MSWFSLGLVSMSFIRLWGESFNRLGVESLSIGLVSYSFNRLGVDVLGHYIALENRASVNPATEQSSKPGVQGLS